MGIRGSLREGGCLEIRMENMHDRRCVRGVSVRCEPRDNNQKRLKCQAGLTNGRPQPLRAAGPASAPGALAGAGLWGLRAVLDVLSWGA